MAKSISLKLRIPPVIIVLVAVLLMWLVTAILDFGSFDFASRKAVVSGLILTAIATVLMGVYAFRRASTTVNPTHPDRTSVLVTAGIYRVSRNPMYLGMLLLLAAVLVAFANAVNVIVLSAFVVYMTRFQIIPEEQVLEKKFGDAFCRYKDSVRRWL